MQLTKAQTENIDDIWLILQDAIEQRKIDGSQQWQNGYPNLKTIKHDIENNCGYVIINKGEILAYAAIIIGEEKAYNSIQGKWYSDEKYLVVHRVATLQKLKRKGIGTTVFQLIEDFAKEHDIWSIRVDTMHDNIPMLKILRNLEYLFCGVIYYESSPRLAFEKLLR